MKEFDKSIAEFLKLIQSNTGANPVFSLDYEKKCIILKDASSGFLKRLYESDKVCAHLTSEGIKLTYFS